MRRPQLAPPQGIFVYWKGARYELDRTLHYLGYSNGAHHWQAFGPSTVRWGPGEQPQINVKVVPLNSDLDIPLRNHPDGTVSFRGPLRGVRR